MGMTAPMPVTTARRAGSALGGTGEVLRERAVAARVVRRRGTLRDGWAGVRWRAASIVGVEAGSVPVVALEDHRAVVPAQADVVGDRVADLATDGLPRDVEVDRRVGIAEGRHAWHGLVVDREHGEDRLDRARRAHEVAGPRLRRAAGDLRR